jgi:hypothetical protein
MILGDWDLSEMMAEWWGGLAGVVGEGGFSSIHPPDVVLPFSVEHK